MNIRNKSYILFSSLGMIFFSIFGSVLPSSSQTQPNCGRASTTIESNRCERLAYESADRELNSVWRRVISQLNGNEKEDLIDRQLAWIEERDTTCDRETAISIRGSGYRGFLSACLRRVTMERTEILREYLR